MGDEASCVEQDLGVCSVESSFGECVESFARAVHGECSVDDESGRDADDAYLSTAGGEGERGDRVAVFRAGAEESVGLGLEAEEREIKPRLGGRLVAFPLPVCAHHLCKVLPCIHLHPTQCVCLKDKWS